MASLLDDGRKYKLLSCLAAYFLSMAMIYQMSPFFQLYAEKVSNVRSNTVGLIYAVMPAACFVGSFWMERMIATCGAETSLNLGLALLALSSVGFGMSRTLASWLFWRSLQGLATAPIYTSISTLLARTYTSHDEFQHVTSLQQIMGNVGATISPILGGSMYDRGGFEMPFFVFALVDVLFLGVSLCASDRVPKASLTNPLVEDRKQTEAEDAVQLTPHSVASLPVLLLCGVPLVCTGLFGAYEPLLGSRFARTLGPISSATTGFLVSLCGVASSVFTFFAPYLAERMGARPTMTLGLLFFALGISCFGVEQGQPGSWQNWTLQPAGLLLIGLGWGLCWTPSLPAMVQFASLNMPRHHGWSAETARGQVSPAVSALFFASSALGEAFGPLLGTHLLSHGFQMASRLFAAGLAAFALSLHSATCPTSEVQGWQSDTLCSTASPETGT